MELGSTSFLEKILIVGEQSTISIDGLTESDITLQQYLMIWEMNLPDDLKHVAKIISHWFGY